MNDIKFYDLPKDMFPFTVEFVAINTRKVVHTIEVAGPGAMQIPYLAGEHGLVTCRIIHDGEIVIDIDEAMEET